MMLGVIVTQLKLSDNLLRCVVMPDRPATCSSCNKRLSKKTWYYRNGQYFCKKGCWKTAAKKASDAAAKAATGAEGQPAEKSG